jgi:hypothetical protein
MYPYKWIAHATKAKKSSKSGKTSKSSKERPESKGNPEGKKKKLTPAEVLARARAARAKGGKSAAPRKRAKPITFQRPDDMKPQVLHIDLKVAKDGLIGGAKITAWKGNPESDTAKSLELSQYDNETALRLMSRIGSAVWVPNVAKRLEPKSNWRLVMRVSSNKDGNILSRLREVAVQQEKRGKLKYVPLTYGEESPENKAKIRLFRKLHKIGAAAFVNLQPFPDAKTYKAMLERTENGTDDEETPRKKRTRKNGR